MPKSAPEDEGTRIEVVGEINTSIAYANFARVRSTPYEALITFARIDPATAAGREDVAETVDAPAVVRIALPHQVLVGLRRAIEGQMRRHPGLYPPTTEED